MKKTLYTINTINNFMEIIYDPFGKPFAQANPEIRVKNIMDDSLLEDTRTYGGMTPTIASRMLNYAKAAEGSGADGIIVTCTSVNHATKMIRPLLNIPIINIEEPVAEMAAMSGKRIGVLGTIPTSPGAISWEIEEAAARMGKEIEIVPVVVEGAFDVLCAGDREKHDQMVCQALYQLAKEVDCVVFAQISMSLLEHEPVEVPVLKIGASGFEKIKELMEKQA
jgi:Asp/Glu/hydantoin racemase